MHYNYDKKRRGRNADIPDSFFSVSLHQLCKSLYAHKQSAIHVTALKIFDDLRKRRQNDHNTGHTCQSGTCYLWTRWAHLLLPKKPAALSNEQVATDTLVSCGAEGELSILPVFIHSLDSHGLLTQFNTSQVAQVTHYFLQRMRP